MKKGKQVNWKFLRYILPVLLLVLLFVKFRDIYLTEQKADAGQALSQEYREQALKGGFTEEMLSEVKYFPVAAEYETGRSCGFDDSYLADRTYGGDRRHEGTDIMASDKEAGYYPVVSMTDGTIEQIGWLELGGYRVGIRSEGGTYYYYAHLDSYSEECKKGAEIKAGTLLGFVGDSGYGEEGTTGKFDPHLHLGVYVQNDGEDSSDTETAVNPFPLLKLYENNKIFFHNTVSK